VQSRFPLSYTRAGSEACAVDSAVAKGDSLVVCFQDFLRTDTGLSVWFTIENLGDRACRWFGPVFTAYASPQYEEIQPTPDDRGGHRIIDIYPGEQYTRSYSFHFDPNVRGPKLITCRSRDKDLTSWWARGA